MGFRRVTAAGSLLLALMVAILAAITTAASVEATTTVSITSSGSVCAGDYQVRVHIFIPCVPF